MVRVVNIIPRSLSGEFNQDSEPNLAVNPAKPRHIAASAFTPNPLGGDNAPIFVSSDGGKTWSVVNSVPSQAGAATGDITLRFGNSTNNLYTGILRRPGFLRLNILRATNFQSSATMTVLVDRLSVDQPYVQTAPRRRPGGRDRVYVGNNDFAAAGGRTATVDVSLDAVSPPPPGPPSGFTPARIEARATSGQDGPPIRPAVHRDGTVYAAFYRWTSFVGGVATSDVVVVRDDGTGTVAPFSALTDPSDGLPGRIVVQNRLVPFINQSQPSFGQERFVGSNLTIALDPKNSSRVYLSWADRVGATDYTLHVRRSRDRGVTWSTNDIRTVVNATNPALAINENGTIGFLYQQLTGTGASQRWVTHFERTDNNFQTINDRILCNAPANTPAPQFIPYIGDYVHVMAVKDDFYGIFSANNTPDKANFPSGVVYQRNANFTTKTLLGLDGVTPVPISIDPFFFKATDDDDDDDDDEDDDDDDDD
jgi:hypothetical protein